LNAKYQSISLHFALVEVKVSVKKYCTKDCVLASHAPYINTKNSQIDGGHV